jgi:para-aminobenzoate synthetase component 1
MLKKIVKHKIPYLEPIEVFKCIPESINQTFLYSASTDSNHSKNSILALFENEVLTDKSFSTLSKTFLKKQTPIKSKPILFSFIGYFSYDLKNEFEKLPIEQVDILNHSDYLFIKYHVYIIFNSNKKVVTIYASNSKFLEKTLDLINQKRVIPKSTSTLYNIKSNFSKKSYLNAINKIKNYIIEGDIFEANLTRKIWAEIKGQFSSKETYINLVKKSPTPYSAYFKHQDLIILSSSMERFLQIKKNKMSSLPIKGTRARGTNQVEDKKLFLDLKYSEKDRAENLMIVDLVRNDFGKVAKIGSVVVPKLFTIKKYKPVYQMISSINAKLAKNKTMFDAIEACFPPGSMTGAPKIRAIEICTELENVKRGIYSGAFGWLSFNNECDLSVVIRTIIIKGSKLEIQSGGAIVYDSDPETEFAETITKLETLASVLGINLDSLNQ